MIDALALLNTNSVFTLAGLAFVGGGTGVLLLKVVAALCSRKDIVASVTLMGHTFVVRHDGDGDGSITDPVQFDVTADAQGVRETKEKSG